MYSDNVTLSARFIIVRLMLMHMCIVHIDFVGYFDIITCP